MTSPPRAHRFALQLRLRYRPAGHPIWQEGHTENVSRTGVLFVANAALEVHTPLEMLMFLDGGPLGAAVQCHGRIVRVVTPATPGGRLALAAQIAGYRIVRCQHLEA